MSEDSERFFSVSPYRVVSEMRRKLEERAASVPCDKVDKVTPEQLMDGVVPEASATFVETI